MNLPKIALKNYLFVLVVILLAIFLGIKSFLTMPRSEDPFLSLPNYTLVVAFPGTSPEDMEELVVAPLEEAIDELDEITEIRTEISNGLAVIQVEAEFGIDYDVKHDEILAKINNVRGDLPDGIVEFDFRQFVPEDRVVVHQYAITTETASYEKLFDVAEDFQDEIEKIKYVKNTEIEADPAEEVRIDIDYQKMANLGIPLRQVISVLQGNNRNVPGGNIRSGALSFNVKSTGSFENAEEISNTAIRSADGQIVYLRDFARVRYDHEDLRWIARFNGKKSIYLTVTQKEGSNILTLAEQLRKAKGDFEKTLPLDVSIETAFEQASAVKEKINNFLINLLQGILVVGAIILLFLSWRSALVVITVIPLSIIIAITVLDLTGYAFQQISIASLVIALGLLVDNAIVVIENIARLRREGYSIKEAAEKGTGEVGYAIISSTVTTVLAFVPLALMQSGPGMFLRSLPLTVIFVLIASLLLALTFTPILSSRLLRKKSAEKSTIVIRALERFIEKAYRPALHFSLKRGWIVISVGIALLMGAVMLFPSIGVSFFPTADKPILLIDVKTPYSSSIQRTDKAVNFVEQVLDTTDFVKNYTTNAGHGNPQVYYNRIPEEFKKHHGQVLVNFHRWDPREFYSTLAKFRSIFENYPDARISFRELKNGAPFEASIEVLVIGENLDTLKNLSSDIEKIIRGTEGTLDVDNPMAVAKTDLKVEINRDKAAIYGLSLLDADRTVRASLNGLTIDRVNMDKDDEEYGLVLRIPFTEKPSIRDFNKVYFSSQSGHQIPLNQVAKLEFEAGYAKIDHFNLDRNNAITANVVNPDNTKSITERIIPKLDNYLWPEGYTYYLGGEYETQQESFGDLGTLLIVALLGIFAVLVLQFRSIRQPLIIFSAIPLALTGSFVALFLTGWSFSFFAFVGFISLVGIVVNNSIILVDYTNYLMKEEGYDKTEAIFRGAQRRFTPIVLTSLTTILGLMPLTLSVTSLWSPLGWTLIGGMISSTFLTLLVVPVLYLWLTKE